MLSNSAFAEFIADLNDAESVAELILLITFATFADVTPEVPPPPRLPSALDNLLPTDDTPPPLLPPNTPN